MLTLSSTRELEKKMEKQRATQRYITEFKKKREEVQYYYNKTYIFLYLFTEKCFIN